MSEKADMHNRYAIVAGATGKWRITSLTNRCGDGLDAAPALDMWSASSLIPSADAPWVLYGVMSNVRYAQRDELTALKAVQEPLGRDSSRRAALIPIRKSAAWWTLAQDERRAIFEETSHHNRIGMDYLPAVARQLFHCRDLGEPFDFLTWFEYAPEYADAFDELVARLRETREWTYVEREIDIRLERD